MKKFILGTAQLNLRYGIVNPKKKTRHQIYNFLEYCVKNQIYNFDTAEGYNNHKLLGDFLKTIVLVLNQEFLQKLTDYQRTI